MNETPQPPASSDEEDLYEIRKKIHPRAVSGLYARWRVALVLITQAVFYGGPWLYWDHRQAILFDLVHRKFYIFGLILWPQDFVFLTGLLVISAYALFLFTSVAGRLWCGYACPQTVYTELFLWIERRVEGDRNKRIALDQSPWNREKILRRGTRHLLWIVVALWTGFTFVGYFTPITELTQEVAQLGLGPWETFWIFFYAFATWGNAGFMREQICKYMCPYARFQSAMFDPDTLIVTYDQARGEPRGSRSRRIDHRAAGKGDCVDCGICVQVCPTGIDIRNGLQYECIACSACIDACDQVMDKMGYAPGLIRNTSENVLAGQVREQDKYRRMMRPRTLIYTAVLVILLGAFFAAVSFRTPARMNIIRDRAVIYRINEQGLVENVYRLQLMNMVDKDRQFTLSMKGLEGATLQNLKQPIEMKPLSVESITVDVDLDPNLVKTSRTDIEFTLTAVDDPSVVVKSPSVFFGR
jgi:cytochrome c oxidase accessory protein FixG